MEPLATSSEVASGSEDRFASIFSIQHYTIKHSDRFKTWNLDELVTCSVN
jgi:hypothetical protein